MQSAFANVCVVRCTLEVLFENGCCLFGDTHSCNPIYATDTKYRVWLVVICAIDFFSKGIWWRKSEEFLCFKIFSQKLRFFLDQRSFIVIRWTLFWWKITDAAGLYSLDVLLSHFAELVVTEENGCSYWNIPWMNLLERMHLAGPSFNAPFVRTLEKNSKLLLITRKTSKLVRFPKKINSRSNFQRSSGTVASDTTNISARILLTFRHTPTVSVWARTLSLSHWLRTTVY